jgi:hypothetical protein
MDARCLFCFAKNGEQPMTGSVAVVGRQLSVVGGPSSVVFPSYTFEQWQMCTARKRGATT